MQLRLGLDAEGSGGEVAIHHDGDKLEHAPWASKRGGLASTSDARLLARLLQNEKPSSSPLFRSHLKDLRMCLAALFIDMPGEQSEDEEIWAWLKSRQTLGKAGRRIVFSRFMAPIEGCLRHSPE
mgnify:CR=1 FL=1